MFSPRCCAVFHQKGMPDMGLTKVAAIIPHSSQSAQERNGLEYPHLWETLPSPRRALRVFAGFGGFLEYVLPRMRVPSSRQQLELHLQVAAFLSRALTSAPLPVAHEACMPKSICPRNSIFQRLSLNWGENIPRYFLSCSRVLNAIMLSFPMSVPPWWFLASGIIPHPASGTDFSLISLPETRPAQ